MVEIGLVAHLQADAAVSARVGSRVYWARLPDKAAFPALVYTMVSSVSEEGLDGAAGIGWKRVEVTAWAKNTDGVPAFATAKRLAEEVRLSLQGFTGTWDGTEIVDVILDESSDVELDPESGVLGVEMDFIIWHREPVP